MNIVENERAIFDNLLVEDISKLNEEDISSSGYVVHTLEASIWCLLNSTNYKDAVLRAVNLGDDTDTTSAVTGGLAALLYGYQSIPTEWLEVLARRNDIEELANRMNKA
jgi:ADP-ribosylglycohydrolase